MQQKGCVGSPYVALVAAAEFVVATDARVRADDQAFVPWVEAGGRSPEIPSALNVSMFPSSRI